MALLLKVIYGFYQKFLKDYEDPRVDGYPLMSSPLPTVTIIALYIYFVKSLGPLLMKHRKPFDLKPVINVYNLFQVAANLINVSVCLHYLFNKGLKLDWLCILAPWNDSSEAYRVITKCSYFYFILKIIDLLDTVFFVLRKRDRQVTFLHCYHHAGMVAIVYINQKFFSGGGHGISLGILNSFVHCIMYFYYFTTTCNIKLENQDSWKKRITQIQMLQFLAIAIHNAIPLFTDCQFLKIGHIFLIMQNLFMLALFSDFYIKTYFIGNKRKSAEH